jgi:hypothetical protein
VGVVSIPKKHKRTRPRRVKPLRSGGWFPKHYPDPDEFLQRELTLEEQTKAVLNAANHIMELYDGLDLLIGKRKRHKATIGDNSEPQRIEIILSIQSDKIKAAATIEALKEALQPTPPNEPALKGVRKAFIQLAKHTKHLITSATKATFDSFGKAAVGATIPGLLENLASALRVIGDMIGTLFR